jgi:hypothetical protein
VFTSAAECILYGDDLVVAVGLDNADLVGTDFLVYAKFVNVSNGGVRSCV